VNILGCGRIMDLLANSSGKDNDTDVSIEEFEFGEDTTQDRERSDTERDARKENEVPEWNGLLIDEVVVERDGDCSAKGERKSNARKGDDGGLSSISVDDTDVDLEGSQEQIKHDTDCCREIEIRDGGSWEDGICEAGYPTHDL